MSNDEQIRKRLHKILIKIERFCAYQDRCKSEVYKKLETFQISSEDKQWIIEDLENKKFLDEDRFAHSFVNGKLKYNQWGRYKIRIKLKEKKVSSNLIEQALMSIDEKLYGSILQGLAQKKQAQLASKDFSEFEIEQKTKQYLLGKGFTYDDLSKYF